jgi:septum formation inhibitor-activating ATPase MinD
VVAGAVIPDDPAVALSLLRGNPVVLENPGCDASQAFHTLVDNLIGVERPVSSLPMAAKPLRHFRQLSELGHRARVAAVASVRGDR